MWAWLGMWCSFQAWLQELWKALKSTLVTLRRPPLRSVNQALSTTLQPKWSPWRLQSVWQLCNGAGHTCHKCPHRFDHAYVVTILIDSLSALSMGETRNPTWYLDSGTFVHMTNDSGILWKIQPHIQSNMIILENGHLLPINEVGSSSITTSLGSLMLSNVYYVPSLSRNLLFIQQFYKDTSCIVSFDDSIFFVKDKMTGTTLLRSDASFSLYMVPSGCLPSQLFVASIISMDQWHHCPNYPHIRAFDHFCKSIKLP